MFTISRMVVTHSRSGDHFCSPMCLAGREHSPTVKQKEEKQQQNAIDDEIPCFMAEPADATEDGEEEFERVDDNLALEGGPPLIASITSKPSLRRSLFASKLSTLSVVESSRRWKLERQESSQRRQRNSKELYAVLRQSLCRW